MLEVLAIVAGVGLLVLCAQYFVIEKLSAQFQKRDEMLMEFVKTVVDRIRTPDESTQQLMQALIEPSSVEDDELKKADDEWLKSEDSIIEMEDDLAPVLGGTEDEDEAV